jgi:hypothetical protein
MTALVSVETVLLVVLVLLVAGLLRSHAEILRRLGPEGGPGPEDELGPAVGPQAPPARRTGEQLRAPAIAGHSPHGDVATLSFEGPASTSTLLAFLTSGCSTCAGFWDTLGERGLPHDVQTVIMTKGSERERPARIRSLAPSEVPVVMSSQAWEDYAVPGAPYFVLVEDGGVSGEGSATTWQAVASLVTDAIADNASAPGAARRARDIERTLAAAGIGPEHPSLYPGERK